LWNRHNERRLLRFGFDIPENLGNFQLQVKNKATVDAWREEVCLSRCFFDGFLVVE